MLEVDTNSEVASHESSPLRSSITVKLCFNLVHSGWTLNLFAILLFKRQERSEKKVIFLSIGL